MVKALCRTFLADQARRAIACGWWAAPCPLQERVSPGRVYGSCLVFNDQGERVAAMTRSTCSMCSSPTARSPTTNPRPPPRETRQWWRHALRAPGDRGVLRPALPRTVSRYAGPGHGNLLALPAAFTAITGRAHWEALIRARAIENQIYLVAAAQGGYHVNGRETHGDSMVVDPWGQVLDRLARGSGVVLGELHGERIASIRRSFPSLSTGAELRDPLIPPGNQSLRVELPVPEAPM
jgi:deaminated glutathione amidase